ncbi:MAG: ATP-binding cassette domain-containing protein [Gammaproteobacteria bacterium]|nr:ATP-binding cassette domain-containing protein [Gammaproteobacteria bacterium]
MRYGSMRVYEDVDLVIERGERLGLVGGSGSGKSTMMRQMIGLQAPTAGRVTVFGQTLYSPGARHAQMLRDRCGVLFQAGGLFTDLNVYDNVALPLRELRVLDEDLIRELVYLKLRLVGLAPETAGLMPYELSGGMTKRAGLARALALEPELLFLDEPTSGLDPIGSENFVRLIGRLHSELEFTMVLVTHDLLSLPALCDRIAVLADGRLAAVGTLDEILASQHPTVQKLFHGARAQQIFGARMEAGHA